MNVSNVMKIPICCILLLHITPFPLQSTVSAFSSNCKILSNKAFVNQYEQKSNNYANNIYTQRQSQNMSEMDVPSDVDISMKYLSDVEEAKKDLQMLSITTNRGFDASASDRKEAKKIVDILKRNNPTSEPASAYYENVSNDDDDDDDENDNDNPVKGTLAGKWTLIYTDAPDITSLSSTPTAKLGRIGQECNPPEIKNVIEWKKPDWASNIPFSGNENSRILQKVCCEGVATPERPNEVDLKIVGLDLLGDDDESINFEETNGNIYNGPVSILKQTGPLELRGFVKPPFGKFEVLYLDENMRVIKTYQGYLAVNVRDEEWF